MRLTRKGASIVSGGVKIILTIQISPLSTDRFMARLMLAFTPEHSNIFEIHSTSANTCASASFSVDRTRNQLHKRRLSPVFRHRLVKNNRTVADNFEDARRTIPWGRPHPPKTEPFRSLVQLMHAGPPQKFSARAALRESTPPGMGISICPKTLTYSAKKPPGRSPIPAVCRFTRHRCGLPERRMAHFPQ